MDLADSHCDFMCEACESLFEEPPNERGDCPDCGGMGTIVDIDEYLEDGDSEHW